MGNSAWTSWLQDPLQVVNTATSALPALVALAERRRQRRDPTLRGLVNDRIAMYNAARANAGSPETGYGGAFGVDAQGHPLSLGGATAQYGIGQAARSGAMFAANQGGRNELLAHSSAAGRMPTGMHLGVDSPAWHPEAVQGVDPSLVGPRPAVPPLRDLPKYAVGINSVPQDQVAVIHQGEAVIPKAMNPMAGQAPRPLATPAAPARQTLGAGVALPRPLAAPAPLPQPAGAVGVVGTGAPAAAPVPSPRLNVNLQAMTPGLDMNTQQQLIRRATEQNDAAAGTAARGIRDSAGSVYSGNTNEDLFANELARRAANTGVNRDVGIAAAQQRFGDTLAMNQLELQRGQAAAGVELDAGRLGLDSDLGHRAANTADYSAQTQRTAVGNDYDIAGRRIGLDTELGRRSANTADYAAQTQRTAVGNDYDIAGRRIGLDSDLGHRAANTADFSAQTQRTAVGNDYDIQGRQVANQRYGLETDRTNVGNVYDLGLRDVNLRGQQLGFDQNRWQDQYARDVYNDNTNDQRWWTERNDRLIQGLLDNGMSQQELEALLGDQAGSLASQMA